MRTSAELPSEAKVFVVFGEAHIPLQRDSRDAMLWTGDASLLTDAGGTKVGRLLIVVGKESAWSLPRWLDELHRLGETSGLRSVAEVLEDFGTGRDVDEHAAQLRELASIGAAILSDSREFPDPGGGRRGGKEEKPTDAEMGRVDLDTLIRSLSEIGDHPLQGRAGVHGPGVPVAGVMRALFPPDEEEPTETDTDDKGEEEGERATPPRYVEKQERQPPPHDLRAALRRQMEEFLRRFGDKEFAGTCTATQMVQAAAYPLAVAAVGMKTDWVSVNDAADWTCRVADLLFGWPSAFQRTSRGVLDHVAARYESPSGRETFARVVGDGTLWLALTAALAEVPWEGPELRFKQILATVRAFSCPYLRPTSEPTRLRILLSRLRHIDARKTVLTQVPELRRKLRTLEAELRRSYDILVTAQLDERLNEWHEVGDPVWHGDTSFGFVEKPRRLIYEGSTVLVRFPGTAEPVTVQDQSCVNVHVAARHSPKIEQMLNSLGICPPPKRPPIRIIAQGR